MSRPVASTRCSSRAAVAAGRRAQHATTAALGHSSYEERGQKWNSGDRGAIIGISDEHRAKNALISETCPGVNMCTVLSFKEKNWELLRKEYNFKPKKFIPILIGIELFPMKFDVTPNKASVYGNRRGTYRLHIQIE